MPPALRIRPYKDFLTPALHRRFVSAMAVLIILCYAESLAIGQYNGWFWTWFPLGRAGIRAGLLFISAFSVFILRVAQLHVGIRTTTSPLETFRLYAFRYDTVQTALWYFFSAWFFCEVLIFSSAEASNIRWITSAASFERPRLNERPIFLMSHFLILGLSQTVLHLFYDYDRVDMPVSKAKPEVILPPLTQIYNKSLRMAFSALFRAIGMTLLSPIIYVFFIRRTAWSYTLAFAKFFWSLPKSTSLPTTWPFHIKILGKTFTGGFLIILLWEIANIAFSAYVAQEPLKNERPITHESRDPNGSLLTGLNGKKLQTRAFAFWELVYISQRFQGRRKMIYEDIDRKGGSAWAQILAACLNVINGVESRITEYQTPPVVIPAVAPVDPSQALPHIAQPPSRESIFANSPPPKSRKDAAAHLVGDFAKRHGHSRDAKSPQLIEQAKESLRDPAAMVPSGLQAAVKDNVTFLLKTTFAWPFRHTYRRRIAAVVLGSPYGDVGITVDAVDALTRLAVCSLTEDQYGNVQRDVKLIIQTLTSAVKRLESFKQSIGFHWTDVEKKQQSPEVDTILASMKGSLQELLAAFGDYSQDLRLSQSDMRNAREAAADTGVEMAQKR
ncbi:hypothetical protein BP5796_02671 [Coleophoma crateriformis]|uniref:Nuclear envelope protein n=1 Tax=Coleophoma crateriformis TaxID=565419 RepID=A0A3D8SYY3_9HELO|nr:hypothetical protein BP5796_02671 [Coleophoma crateriformis]